MTVPDELSEWFAFHNGLTASGSRLPFGSAGPAATLLSLGEAITDYDTWIATEYSDGTGWLPIVRFQHGAWIVIDCSASVAQQHAVVSYFEDDELRPPDKRCPSLAELILWWLEEIRDGRLVYADDTWGEPRILEAPRSRVSTSLVG